jgi:hypothetical protein
LWQYSQELRPETSTPSQPSVQERQEAFEEFQQRLQHQVEAFEVSQQVFEDKLHILREQRKTVLAIPDPVQRHQAFHQLQAEYQQLQQEVREQKLLLREQRATYHQLRGDYEVSTGNCMLRDSSDSNGRKSDAGNGLVTRERFIVFCLAAGIQEQKKERQQGALKSAGRNRCLDMT